MHAQTLASYSAAYRFGGLYVVNANSAPRLVDFNYSKSPHIDVAERVQSSREYKVLLIRSKAMTVTHLTL